MITTAQLSGAKSERGFNQCTASGLPFWVGDPRPEDIRITDIAAQLSRACRFGGALRDEVDFYSVAQHCCLVSDHCPPAWRLEGLLHDAHEAYIGDMLKPVKLQVPAWKALEGRVELAVRRRFGLPDKTSPEVKAQDVRAVVTEHQQLQVVTGLVDWGPIDEVTPWPETIDPWPPRIAREQFMMRFRRYYEGE